MPEELALTTHEQRQLLDLLDPEAEIEVIIPQSIDAEQLMKTLGLCCRSSMIADRRRSNDGGNHHHDDARGRAHVAEGERGPWHH